MKSKKSKLEKEAERKEFIEGTKEWAKAMLIPLTIGSFIGIAIAIDYGLDKVFPNYISHKEKLENLQIEKERSVLEKYDKNKDYVIDSTEFIYKK